MIYKATHLKTFLVFSVLMLATIFASWHRSVPMLAVGQASPSISPAAPSVKAPPSRPIARAVSSAKAQTKRTIYYDPAYVSLSYPGGDVPPDRGVCTDVVVRALRAAGVDLQQKVHEDMRAHFGAYPRKWGLKRPDSNIDHRRVPNLQTYFKRYGKSLPITDRGREYQPGDIVSWKLSNGLDHIGIVSDAAVFGQDRYTVIHNIGRGVEQEDVLFAWKITGHYRYFAR